MLIPPSTSSIHLLNPAAYFFSDTVEAKFTLGGQNVRVKDDGGLAIGYLPDEGAWTMYGPYRHVLSLEVFLCYLLLIDFRQRKKNLHVIPGPRRCSIAIVDRFFVKC